MIQLPIYASGRDTGQLYAVAPSKIIALGLNYRDHISENRSVKVQGFTGEVPAEPVLFPKTPNTLIGPGETIVIPAFLKSYGFDEFRVDYEAELAFFVKDRCKDVEPRDAFGHIYGYTCFNDISQRNVQNLDRSGWFRGKSFDTFGPVGPRVVLQEEIRDPQNLRIQCRLNGRTVQDSSTRCMIFPVAEILAFVSRNFTLEAGDIISTGTPSGVGPLRPGDLVEVEIEKIGVLSNPVAEELR